jgi:hypothetical protein
MSAFIDMKGKKLHTQAGKRGGRGGKKKVKTSRPRPNRVRKTVSRKKKTK